MLTAGDQSVDDIMAPKMNTSRDEDQAETCATSAPLAARVSWQPEVDDAAEAVVTLRANAGQIDHERGRST